jgi:hypothetical protein
VDPVPARAVVVKNTYTTEVGVTAYITHFSLPVRLADGREAKVSDWARGHHASLITAGMEIPIFVDPATGDPSGLDHDNLDEAIGRYYHRLNPDEYGSWEEALAYEKKIHKQQGEIIAPIRWELEAWRDTAKELPGALRETVKSWRSALKGIRDDTPRVGARVSAISATFDQENGQTVWEITLDMAGRTVVHRQALSDEKAGSLRQVGWAEVELDPADPQRIAIR